MNSHRLMIVAGEASGDAHAASLVQALRAVEPETRFDFFGATGPLLRAAGVESIVNSDDLSILGLVEIGRALPKFWRAFRALKRAALERSLTRLSSSIGRISTCVSHARSMVVV